MSRCDDIDIHPKRYIAFMHTVSFVAPPVNIYTIYCILYKSPKQMSAFKWYLLLYQVTSTIFDFIYSIVTLPVIFFPLPMGYTGSWIAEWTSLGVHATLIAVILAIPCVCACIFSLFAYRIYVIIPQHHFLKSNERSHIYASILFFVVYSLPTAASLIDSSPDQDMAKEWIVSRYSCAHTAMHVPRLHIYTPDSIKRLLISVLILVCMIVPIGLLILGAAVHFLRSAGHLSKRTRTLQLRFFIFLCVQVAVPAIAYALPIFCLAIVLGTMHTKLRFLGDVSLVLIGLHGTISSISLVLCNEPYREFTLNLLIYRWFPQKPQQRVVVSFTKSSDQSRA